MKRVLTVGFSIVGVWLLFSMTGVSAQRRQMGDVNSGTTTPIPVAVNNFPVNEIGELRVASPTGGAAVVPTYYCQLSGNPLPGGLFQLNHGINFQPIGLPGIQTFISLNDDPASTGTTADCVRLVSAIANAGASAGCNVGPTLQISATNIQLRMICTGETHQVMQTVSTLTATVFALHAHPAP